MPLITGTKLPNDLILSEYNEYNLDHNNNINKYVDNCGLDECSVSFGHDEYLYRLLKYNNHKLPLEAEYMIRYHSLYAWHSGTGSPAASAPKAGMWRRHTSSQIGRAHV